MLAIVLIISMALALALLLISSLMHQLDDAKRHHREVMASMLTNTTVDSALHASGRKSRSGSMKHACDRDWMRSILAAATTVARER